MKKGQLTKWDWAKFWAFTAFAVVSMAWASACITIWIYKLIF